MLRHITQSLLVISIVVAALMTLALVTLRLLGGQLLVVQSNSMEPIFRKSDAIVSLPVQPHDIREGLIVSYRNPTGNGMMISHRVVAVDKKLDTITTHGDAQRNSTRVTMAAPQVTGRVVGVIPGAGRMFSVAHHPIALLLLVYIPSAIFIYRETHRLQLHFAEPRYKLVSRN